MSSSRFTPRGFPRVPLQNGIGRYICQLKRVTLRFCKSSGSSRGIRDFIETDLVSFAQDHPGTALYLKPRRHKSPSFVAEYLNGEREVISCHNFTATNGQVVKFIHHPIWYTAYEVCKNVAYRMPFYSRSLESFYKQGSCIKHYTVSF
uniref:Large ribosomal subunit protein mL43 n=1 Tax=Acyrthosiphon pisum TaxID=7029 RepID=C4WWI6_ACYPI|nr:ACYPI004785 [Acyrthosiphon pisum]